jgi:hypothetical protein
MSDIVIFCGYYLPAQNQGNEDRLTMSRSHKHNICFLEGDFTLFLF